MIWKRKCFINTAFQLFFRICHQVGPRKTGLELNGTHQFLVYADDVTLGEKEKKHNYQKEKYVSSIRHM
jgi:hypothetical protein